MKEFQNIAAQPQEVWAAAIPRSGKCNWDRLFDATWALGHNHDAVTHIDGFVDVVSDQEHRSAAGLPKAKQFIRDNLCSCAQRLLGPAGLPEAEHFVLHSHSGK